jgi:hypothetical protein
MALPERLASSPAVHAPSIPLAPPPAVTPAQEHPVRGPALEHAQALAHLAPAVHPVQAQRQPAMLHARRVPPPEVAADARSIPRPRKAQ